MNDGFALSGKLHGHFEVVFPKGTTHLPGFA